MTKELEEEEEELEKMSEEDKREFFTRFLSALKDISDNTDDIFTLMEKKQNDK